MIQNQIPTLEALMPSGQQIDQAYSTAPNTYIRLVYKDNLGVLRKQVFIDRMPPSHLTQNVKELEKINE